MSRNLVQIVTLVLAFVGAASWPARSEARSQRIDKVLSRVQPARIKKDVADLAALGTRFAGTDAGRSTRMVQERLRQSGLEVRLDPFSFSGLSSSNVIAVVKGSTKQPPIIVSAHYDSIAFPATDAPGAEDNASGTAALIEVARVLGPETLATEVRLVAFGAEEEGLVGSMHMARALSASGKLDQIQAVINMDMVGYHPGAEMEIILEGYPVSRSLAARLARAVTGYSQLKVSATLYSGGWSDHAPFAARGVPALMVATAWHRQYEHIHTAGDLPRYVDPNMVAQVVRGMAARVLLMAGFSDGPPVARVSDIVDAEEGETVRLSGKGSFDPGGKSLSYTWVQIDGPDVEVTTTGAELSFVPRGPGAHRFQLTVKTPDGRTSEPEIGAAVVPQSGCAVGSGAPDLLSVLLLTPLALLWRRRRALVPGR